MCEKGTLGPHSFPGWRRGRSGLILALGCCEEKVMMRGNEVSLGRTEEPRQLGAGPCREQEVGRGLRLCYFSSGPQTEGTDPEDPGLEKLGHRVLNVLKTPKSSILCTVCCELPPLPPASSPKSPSLSGPFSLLQGPPHLF